MPGHYGTLIVGNRSRRALSAVRSITVRAATFRYLVAHYIVRDALSPRAHRGLVPLASLIIVPVGECAR